ncbi:MAG: carbamoyl-phosphate synthase large subunit [Fastidiosipilaceae bacterium]|jgi:carbamoyl-phosphate synthase large subunit
MPKRPDIKKVMMIGSGPIIIGQAAEFDYAGTQACRTLREEGLEVVLLNSNPATIMTDADMADHVYIEALQIDVVKRILLEEKCDSLLATLGGQTGLNFAMELSESGFLEEHGIQLLGTSAAGIKKGEDREQFRDTMLEIGEPCVPSGIAHNLDDCKALARRIGYPVIVRPAFTLGGTGGGIAESEDEMLTIAAAGLEASRVHQVLIEQSIAGWKELEFEAVRDGAGNAIAVCSMENLDPVGVHTGDSIVFAPALTLPARELEMLRTASLNIVHALGIEGGCNVQFALHPNNGSYAVIEVNPRLSRSSALASKATGYPIAKVATRIALGYRLDEIENVVTGVTTATSEPTLDYVVCKIPKWPFDKFIKAKRKLGTQMKATGEVMSIGSTFEAALMKAIRSLEMNVWGLYNEELATQSDEHIAELLELVDDRRLFVVAEALRRGVSVDHVYEVTRINPYFLSRVKSLTELEREIAEAPILTEQLIRRAAQCCFTDTWISLLRNQPIEEVRAIRKGFNIIHSYKMVDTCAGEFLAKTPYFYSGFDAENEAEPTERKKVVVLGSGPIRIGQGIEFDYCSVHCVQELKQLGYEAIIINNNPETVSTDFDISDRLYFEPLTEDDVRGVLENEKPLGVICQFGGQTAIKLIKAVSDMGYTILGTSADGVDEAEDRERFDKILEMCEIPRPKGLTIFTEEEAVAAAERLIYPVLLRPSYVLGGKGMVICHNEEDVREYMGYIQRDVQEHPILVDKYLMGLELEVDAVSDGEDILIPGIMEHLERAGIHSGDSHSIFPAYISERVRDTIVTYTERLARAMHIVGLLNIQYILYNNEVYVIEVNPRSSRTIPYISKVTGLPIVNLATRVMMGEKVRNLGHGTGLFARYPAVYAIKAPVFSFEKLHDVDTALGPEMKSTGEVLGLDLTYSEAMYKAILASGFKFPKPGSKIILTVSNSDKYDLITLAERLFRLGYELYGTGGTANYLNRNGIPTSTIRKVNQESPNAKDLVLSGQARLLINTTDASNINSSGFALRRICIEHGVPTITSLDTLVAVVECLEKGIQPWDLKPISIDRFAKYVKETKANTLPLHEIPSGNGILKKESPCDE